MVRCLKVVILCLFGICGSAQPRKTPLFAEMGLGIRSGETALVEPWGRPAGGYTDPNDGRLRYWMGGPIVQLGIAAGIFKNTHTGIAVRPSFHHIRSDFFIMPNFILYHDWYYRQKQKPNVWTFGFQVVANQIRLPSSGRPPTWAQNAGLNIILDDIAPWTFGFGARGGRLLAKKGWLANTYLKAELSVIVPQKNGYPGEPLLQAGLGVFKNIKLR